VSAAGGDAGADAARAKLARPSLVMLGVLGLLVSLAPLAIDLYLPALPELSRDLGASAASVQITLTTCLIGLGLGQLVAGPLADRLGRRRPLLIGLAGFVVASVLCAIAPNVAVLGALRLLQGLFGAAGIVIAYAVVRDLYGPGAARIFALLLLVTGLAPVVAPLVGGQLLAIMSWRGLFVLLAGLGALLLAASALWLRETLPPERRHAGGLRHTGQILRRLVVDRTFVPFAAAFALAFAALFSYIAASPFVLEDIHGLSPQVFAVVFAVNSAALIGAAQVSGRVVDRVGSMPLLTIGIVGQAIGGLALVPVVLLDSGLWPMLACLLVLTASTGLVVPNAMGLALARQGHQAGTASALLGAGQFMMGAVVAPLVGVAGNDTAVPMMLCIAVCSAGAVGALLVARSEPVPARAPG
jgi:MFS transporter, DHA1 family, multidrug resistance protein